MLIAPRLLLLERKIAYIRGRIARFVDPSSPNPLKRPNRASQHLAEISATHLTRINRVSQTMPGEIVLFRERKTRKTLCNIQLLSARIMLSRVQSSRQIKIVSQSGTDSSKSRLTGERRHKISLRLTTMMPQISLMKALVCQQSTSLRISQCLDRSEVYHRMRVVSQKTGPNIPPPYSL